MVLNMSSFRERFGKLTVAQIIEMNNTKKGEDNDIQVQPETMEDN